MNTSNTIPANREHTSPPSIWGRAIAFMVSLVKSFSLIATIGPLEEFGLLSSKHCDQCNAKTRATGRQLRDHVVEVCHAPRFWGIAKPIHPVSPRAPTVATIPHATGRQSGQRRTPRHGGQAKKPSNDPDGGDGEPPRPSRSFSSSRQHSPHLHIDFTRPLTFAGGAR